MRKLKKAFINGTMAILAVVFMGTTVLASELDHYSLQEVFEEERYAQSMYEMMVDKFDNDDYYQHFVEAEERHADSVIRVLANNQLGVDYSKREVEVSDDELQALKDAYQYELDDVEKLAARIEATDNDIEIRLYTRLMNASNRHANSLERAIDLFERGETDLSLQRLCNPRGNFERRGRQFNNRNSENDFEGQGTWKCTGPNRGNGFGQGRQNRRNSIGGPCR